MTKIKSLEDLRKELLPYIKEFNSIPPIEYLKKQKRYDIINYINRKGKGLQAVAISLNLLTHQEMNHKHNPNYWTIDRIKSEYINFHIQNNLPTWATPEQLMQFNRNDLRYAIDEKIQFNNLRAILKSEGHNYAFPRRERGYWRNWNNLLKELQPLIDDLGYLPSQRELTEINQSSIIASIKYFNGSKFVADQLGIPTAEEYRILISWDYDAFNNSIMRIAAKQGYFPTHSDLIKRGNGDLIPFIRRLYGNSGNAARSLGLKTYNDYKKRHDSGYWTKKRVVEEAIKMYDTIAPKYWLSPCEMKNRGYKELASAIPVYLKPKGFTKLKSILRIRGIKLTQRPRSTAHLNLFKQKYHILPQFFQDDELMGYFIAVIAADGHIIIKENSVTLTVNKDDKTWLEKLRNSISPESIISEKPKTNAVSLKITDRKLIKLLLRYMPAKHKSLKLRWPTFRPYKSEQHFVRGYIDGDGTIGVTKNSQVVDGKRKYYYVPRLRILGTKHFLQGLSNSIFRLLSIKPVKVQPKGKENVFVLQYTGKHAVIILEYMYKNARFYLERKKLVFNYIHNASQELLARNYNTPNGKYNTLAKKGQLKGPE